MRNPGDYVRGLRRHGLSSIRIIADRTVCYFAAKNLRVTSKASVAKAATRIYRWPLAQKFWDSTRLDRLATSEFELLITSLLRNKRWQDAVNVAEYAERQGLASLKVALGRAEALWQLKEPVAFNQAREDAISKLANPSQGVISLIRNENQVVNIASRLELLLATEPHLAEIRKNAETLKPEGDGNKAFVFWNSGFDSAPGIVKACVSQQRKIYGSSLVELSAQNLGEFIETPKVLNRVAKLWPANFSDALRVGLLAKHGGLWLDATVYTTEQSLDSQAKYLSSEFFVFNYNGPRIASWFMMSKPGSYQARLLYAAMLDYWSRNRKLKNYFLFHDFFEVLYHLDERFRSEFDNATKLSASPCNEVGRKLLWAPTDLPAFESVLREHPAQKLTYKAGNRDHGAGTLFSHLSSRA